MAQSNFTGRDILPGHRFSRQSYSASACLLRFKTLFFRFPPIPTSWNKSSVSVCSWDAHSLCQETCESGDAFIFEGNVPVQEANTHHSNIDSGPFRWAKTLRRRGMAKGRSGSRRLGVKTSVLSLVRFRNLHQSHLCSLSLSFFFCKMVIIISTQLLLWLNKIIYAKHLTR